MGCEVLPSVFRPHLPWSQGTKSWESQVISSLGTNSALGHHLHMTLIPHLSGSKTCPAFDGKHLNLFGSHKTTASTIWTNHSRAASKLWPDHSPPSQNESLSAGRRAHFIKISFGLMMMSQLNEQEMIIHSNLEIAWTFMLTCKYIHTHTQTHTLALFKNWKGGEDFIPCSAAKPHLHNRGHNSQSGIDFFWFVRIRRCEECRSREPSAPLVFFVYGDRRVHCAETHKLINSSDSPVEIKSIYIKQEETKTGGMFQNKPREVVKNVSLCSVARLFSEEWRTCRFFP